MAAADPTYPLYPIACILSATLLLFVLSTSFVRQHWNLGVTFLCFWLFLENIANGANAIVWADNADIKLYVYCDIVSHLQVITSVVKPMAALIMIRRLYLITSLQSMESPSRKEAYRNRAIEWTLGFLIPLLVAGPLYYVVQASRFEVVESIGCTNAPDGSILSLLLLNSWSVIPPLLCVSIYYPRIARVFYRQSRDINQFLQSNNSVSRADYIRILVLAGFDILLTLPIGVVTIVLALRTELDQHSLVFYGGWTTDHSDWEPRSISYAGLASIGTSTVAQTYISKWMSPVLSFAIFGLFGATPEAWWQIGCVICGFLGWEPTSRSRNARLPQPRKTKFGKRSPDKSVDHEIGSQPLAQINTSRHSIEQGTEDGEAHTREPESASRELDISEDSRDDSNEKPCHREIEHFKAGSASATAEVTDAL